MLSAQLASLFLLIPELYNYGKNVAQVIFMLFTEYFLTHTPTKLGNDLSYLNCIFIFNISLFKEVNENKKIEKFKK